MKLWNYYINIGVEYTIAAPEDAILFDFDFEFDEEYFNFEEDMDFEINE